MAQAQGLRPGENPNADSSVRPEALPGEPPNKGHYDEFHEDAGHHIVPLSTYYKIFASLMVLLVITVVVANFDTNDIGMPWLNVIVALAVAATKAVLIVLFFMHVKYSSKLVWIFASAAYFFLLIMFGMVYADYLSRPWLTLPGH